MNDKQIVEKLTLWKEYSEKVSLCIQEDKEIKETNADRINYISSLLLKKSDLELQIKSDCNDYYIFSLIIDDMFGPWHSGYADEEYKDIATSQTSISLSVPFIDKPIFFNSYYTIMAKKVDSQILFSGKSSKISLKPESKLFYSFVNNYTDQTDLMFFNVKHKSDISLVDFISESLVDFKKYINNLSSTGFYINFPNMEPPCLISRVNPLLQSMTSGVSSVLDSIKFGLVTGDQPNDLLAINDGGWDGFIYDLARIHLKETLELTLDVNEQSTSSSKI